MNDSKFQDDHQLKIKLAIIDTNWQIFLSTFTKIIKERAERPFIKQDTK